MSEQDAFERILTSLQEAAMDDARLSTASALIDDALGVYGNCMAVGDLHSRADTQVYLARFFYQGYRHHEFEREYFDVYFPLDERLPRLRQVPDSQLFHFSDLFSEEEQKTSVVFNECSTRMLARNSINVRLDGPESSSICWVINDPVGGGDWSSARLGLIRRLLPHIRQYVNVRQALTGAGALGASLTEMLDTTGAGIIQLDPRGRLLELNDRAWDLLRTGDGLFDEHGFLFARKQEDNARLQELLARALPSFGAQGVGGSIVVRRSSTLLPLVLHVNPIARQETDSRPWPVAAIVLVVDPESRIRIDPDMAADALGLTKMESRVALLLAEGMSVAQIASATDRKESTIRTHVKHIFAKQGLSRQADLVRLVLSLANIPESRD